MMGKTESYDFVYKNTYIDPKAIPNSPSLVGKDTPFLYKNEVSYLFFMYFLLKNEVSYLFFMYFMFKNEVSYLFFVFTQ